MNPIQRHAKHLSQAQFRKDLPMILVLMGMILIGMVL